jgi:hypothetical protein
MELNTKVTPDMIRDLIPVRVGTDVLTADQAYAIYQALPNGENRLDGSIVRFVHTSFGKLIRHKGFDVIQIIPLLKTIFDQSILIYSEKEDVRAGHKVHTNFDRYLNYLAKIRDGEVVYYVRLTVQKLRARPKTLRNGFIPCELHSIFVSRTQLYKKTTDTPVNSQLIIRATTEPIGGPPETGHAHFHDAKLQQFLEAASFYHK